MAALILPSRRFVQPQGAVKVDWNNPLTRGLVFAVEGDGAFNNAVGTMRGALGSGAAAGIGQQGRQINFSGSVADLACAWQSSDLYAATESTVELLFYNTSSNNPHVFNQWGSSSNHWLLQLNGGTDVIWVAAEDSVGNRRRWDGRAFTLNAWQHVIASWRGGSSYSFAVNGVPKALSAINTTALSIRSSGTSPIQLGTCNAGSDLSGSIAFARAWRRGLSDAEMDRLFANPQDIYRPVPRRIYVDFGAGGAAGAVLEGAAAGAASASGALTTGIPIAGAALAVATASGSLAVGIPLAGAAASLSDATGTLTAQITLSGAALAQAVSSALLSSGITMTAAAVAQAAADGTLVTAIQMLGSAQAQAGATGSLTTSTGGLEGTAQASATASASLTTVIRLSGSAIAQAAASGGLTAGASIDLAGAAVSAAYASGELTVNIALTAQALAQAIAQGSLTAQILMEADAAAQAGAGAALSGGSAFVIPSARTIRAITGGRRPAAIQTTRR